MVMSTEARLLGSLSTTLPKQLHSKTENLSVPTVAYCRATAEASFSRHLEGYTKCSRTARE